MIFRFDGFAVDTELYELSRDGERCQLEPQVFDVLAYLVEHRDRVVTRDELIDRIWPERFISEAALASRMMAARKALGDTGREQRYIRTVHGRGYRFVAPVEVLGGRLEPSSAASDDDAEHLPEQRIFFSTTPDGVRLAYATAGEGPPLVKTANWLSHLEFDWQSPVWRHWMRELSRDHTLLRYDDRGCGLSDWDVPEFSFELCLRDLETVIDASGLEQVALLGVSRGAPVSAAYAARHPERVSRLVLYGGYVKGWGIRTTATAAHIEEREAQLTLVRHGWGRDNPAYRQIFTTEFIPEATQEQMRWFNDLQRVSTSPENAVHLSRMAAVIDVSDVLPQIRVPTLVLHARGDLRAPFEEGRQLAAAIPGARFVPLEGNNHILLEHEPAWEMFLREVRQFLAPDWRSTSS